MRQALSFFALFVVLLAAVAGLFALRSRQLGVAEREQEARELELALRLDDASLTVRASPGASGGAPAQPPTHDAEAVWARLSPEERARISRNYARLRRASHEERARLMKELRSIAAPTG